MLNVNAVNHGSLTPQSNDNYIYIFVLSNRFLYIYSQRMWPKLMFFANKTKNTVFGNSHYIIPKHILRCKLQLIFNFNALASFFHSRTKYIWKISQFYLLSYLNFNEEYFPTVHEGTSWFKLRLKTVRKMLKQNMLLWCLIKEQHRLINVV